ncbi:thioesterase family protein [Arthrobacter sp. Marseille-P9274]|uniref:acyl-CoA thioesterase n=1 Tax=Arthrobacter sp. Marseille-P9274 TaxID=2866572 RepID=UPI0021C9A3DA|nr:thioesterase family protein [Arthrobacter sp. Marseille-P9274]
MTTTMGALEDTGAKEIAEGRLAFQLAYGDCDVVGIAYFAIYYRWMERTYSTWLHAHGIRSGQMLEDLGIVTVGASSGATYEQPARVFDRLSCQLMLDRLGASSYTLGFDFTRDGVLVTRGHMAFACRNPEWEKTPVPGRLAAVLSTLPPRQDGTARR